MSGLDDARDAALQTVTAILVDERLLASEIAADHPEPLELALVLADLVAHVHSRWANTLGLTDDQAQATWRELTADIATWRAMR